MKKISTLYKKDPNDLSRVTKEVDPENNWVFEFGYPTRKFDGTSCAIINGVLYKRFDAKRDKSTLKYKEIPPNAIPCQEPDEITGHWPHWIPCSRTDNGSKYHFEAFDSLQKVEDGTYELCGPKIQGNPENLEKPQLIKHGIETICIETDNKRIPLQDFSYTTLKNLLSDPKLDIEGIVFHHISDPTKMCKIRKCDFGITR